jgi:hypothetical protein
MMSIIIDKNILCPLKRTQITRREKDKGNLERRKHAKAKAACDL